MADWAVHISREHYKEADLWAGRGVKGREAEWVDTANVVWYEVTGLCGFWDGSCESGTCGGGVMIQAFTETLGWAPIHKKCGPVLGRNYLDAELCGCGMLMEILNSVDRQEYAIDVVTFLSPAICIFRRRPALKTATGELLKHHGWGP